jgi:anti-sigma factor RsiW
VFTCPAEEISAYIDGELTAELEVALERHIGVCDICRTALNEQKGFLLALTDTLEREAPIELPEDFTRSVVVNAESKVSGLRDSRGRTWALMIGITLFLLAAAAVGSLAGVLSPLAIAFQKLAALFGALISVLGDLLYAIFAVVRSILQNQTLGPVLTYSLVILATAMLLYFGSRSLRRYFRTPSA